ATCDLLIVSIHWGIEYAPKPERDDVTLAHRMLDAGASVIVGHHPHVVQRVERYRTPDGRSALILFSLGNFLSNQSETYVDGISPDKEGDPRDAIIGLFAAVRTDDGPQGVHVELGNIRVLPVWGENNQNERANGHAGVTVIRPVLIDREVPRLKTRLRELGRNGDIASLTGVEKPEAIETTNHLKTLEHRRKLLLARIDDERLVDLQRTSAGP